MLFLFSNKDGALKDGADFMQTKNSKLHPGIADFYLTNQQGPLHKRLSGLNPKSKFKDGDCRLSDGEAAIIIGHGADYDRLYDEADKDVTEAAIQLMGQIAKDNPNGGYTFFLAACGGAKRQPKAEASLLSTLVKGTPALAEQLKQGKIACWGYTADVRLLGLNGGYGLPDNLIGTHIYGTLSDEKGVEQHCGYDTRLTAQLQWSPKEKGGTYLTFIFSPALYPYQEVLAWDRSKNKEKMETRFKDLYNTIIPTSK